MIAWLSGKVISKKPTSVVIETGGVGYLALVSLPTFYSLPDEGSTASLHIHTHVKEDAIQLYGFATRSEQEVFNRLIGISKVGPKLAITILSGMPSADLVDAVHRKDIVKLSSIPGIGKKTAERLVLELSDKLTDLMAIVQTEDGGRVVSAVYDDSVEALISLGYKKSEAQKAVKVSISRFPEEDLETILKHALNTLAG